MAKLNVKDLDLRGKRVFIRVDFNVPFVKGTTEISSDKRIKAALPTIKYALEQGAGVVLASHLGRPKGIDPMLSLKPVAERLSALLNLPVKMAPDCIGPEVEAMKPAPGEVLLLENLRFHTEEEANDAAFSKKLASLADVYVDDAFGSAHRAHASIEGITHHVSQAAAGLLLEEEVRWLGKVIDDPERPCIALLGGAKVSDKIEVIENLLKVEDKLLIGGAMAYTFLKARGESVGKSLVEEDKLDLAKHLMETAGNKLMLPIDHVVAAEMNEGAASEVATTVPDGMMGLDIGPATVKLYESVIATAKTIVWNGPMGVFEMKPFNTGTDAMARAIAASGAISVIGGGDSEKAIKNTGVADKITHISTGGGASLEFLGGTVLPGVAALTDK